MRVSALEWEWRRWRMRVGEYRGYVGKRPAHFPKIVSPLWWVRLKAFQARRRATLLSPTFTRPGALWRSSDSEDVDRGKAAGLAWGLLQMGGDDWSLLRNRLRTRGLAWGYWFHCRTVADLDRLLALCRDDQAPLCGINVEEELRTTLGPKVIAQRIAASGYRGEIAIIAYGWVQNDVRVTDADLGRYAWLLEMFPQDAEDLWKPTVKLADCVKHARALGVRYPFQLVGTYDMSAAQAAEIARIHPEPPAPGKASPGWYDMSSIPSSLYTADDIGDQWERWL